MCTEAITNGFNYIFVCLPESHPALYDWVAFNEANGKVKTIERTISKGKTDAIWHYRYLNEVPLRAEVPSLSVNWCELSVTRKNDGHRLYLNSWVTHHLLTPQRDILALTKYMWFESWTALLDFMLADTTPKKARKLRKSSRNTS